MYRSDLRLKCLKKENIPYFFFSYNINDFIHRFLKNAVCTRPFNINYSKGPSIKYVRKIFRKTNISNLMICTRTCAYQGVRNISFSENLAYVLNGWPPILLSLVCPTVLRKYDLCKYVNTFKARSQASVNKHNPTYGMCYCALCLVPNATDMAKKISLCRRYDESLFIYSRFVGITV